MGLLILLALIALLVWIDVATIRALVSHRLGVVWWAALVVLLIGGAVGGVWGSLLEYQPTARLRVVGVPFPVGVWQWEGDDWVDYVSPAAPVVVVLNFATFLLASVLPVSAAYLLRWARTRPSTIFPSNH